MPIAGAEADPILLRDRETGMLVFMKYYHSGYRVSESVMRQIRNASRKHVANLLDYHDGTDGTWELWEYCENGSLKDWVARKGGRLDKQQLRTVVIELAEAIHYLHHLGTGIAHRDLKPGNVLVRTENPLDLVLTDFGLAKQQTMTNLTKTVKGTWHYAAPEVYAGESSKRSDWFALGAMIYELYTGRKLFSSADDTEDDENAARSRCVHGDYSAEAIDDERWKMLVRGLLIWEKENRWGFDEVTRWLNGESPEIRDDTESVRQGAYRKATFYRTSWSPTLAHSPEEWVALCKENWSDAAAALAGRVDKELLKFLEQFEGTENAIDVIKSKSSPDAKLVKLQCILDPNNDVLFKDRSLDGDGLKKTLEAGDSGDEAALNWLESVVTNHIFAVYAEGAGSQIASTIDWKLTEWKQQADSLCNQLPEVEKAIGKAAWRDSLPLLFREAMKAASPAGTESTETSSR